MPRAAAIKYQGTAYDAYRAIKISSVLTLPYLEDLPRLLQKVTKVVQVKMRHGLGEYNAIYGVCDSCSDGALVRMGEEIDTGSFGSLRNKSTLTCRLILTMLVNDSLAESPV